MTRTIEQATPLDAAALAELRTAAAAHLTQRFGPGHWSAPATERGVLNELRQASLLVARTADGVIATLRLATKRPWAIDVKYFSPCDRPLYLTSMAVAPALQGTGVGRRAMADAEQVARAWPAGAIRLDAYDAAAGAGGFYRKCGFTEVGRATFRNTPLVYFEVLL